MSSAKCLVPADTFRQKYQSDSAGGTRAVFILASLATLPSEDVVSRRSISLSDEDKNILSKGLGLPPDRWSEQGAIVARYAQDESASIGPQEIFTQQNDMSCHSVLAKLGDFLKVSTDKDGGKKIHCGRGECKLFYLFSSFICSCYSLFWQWKKVSRRLVLQ